MKLLGNQSPSFKSAICTMQLAVQPHTSIATRTPSRIHAAASAAVVTDVTADAKLLFTPLKLGSLQLQHRVIMAPLTRCRAPNNVPVPDMAVYYGQRASKGGLIISEATAISEQARGYPQVPGIYSQEQVEAWKPVVRAVHDKGGLFLCQLWHVGRASHSDYQPGNAAPVSASSIAIGHGFEVHTPKGGPFKYPVPRALDTAEIKQIVQQYAEAAKNAVAAGFDGIEVTGANGYLLDQFWKDSTNQRTDEYGGSDVNKARLLLEVMEAVAAAIGPERVSLRLSPYNTFLDAFDTVERAIEKNVWLMKALEERFPGLAYVHMVEPRESAGTNSPSRLMSHQRRSLNNKPDRTPSVEGAIGPSLDPFRNASNLPFLAAGGYNRDSGIKALSSGHADAVVFGRYFISNPDLPKRFALGVGLTPYNRDTFYSFGLEGYTNYPFMEDHN